MIEALLKVNKNLVAVIVSGNAVEMPWVKEIPSIVQSWYLGSVGGEALADVLSGEVTPSGKLPFLSGETGGLSGSFLWGNQLSGR